MGRPCSGSEAALDEADISIFEGVVVLVFVLVALVTYIWSIVIFLIMLAEVQQFSIWKSIASVLLPILMIGIPIFLLLIAMGG